MIYFSRKEEGKYREFYRAESWYHAAHPFLNLFGYFSQNTVYLISDLIDEGFSEVSEDEFLKYRLIEKLKQ